MKLAMTLTSLFGFLALGMISCAQQAPSKYKTQLAKSEQVWTKMKQQCGGNYSYQQIKYFMLGDKDVTTITVKNNVVVERKHETFQPNGGAELVYKETADKLGTHKNGAAPKTIDELHTIAQASLKEKLPANKLLSMQFNKQGLIQMCLKIDPTIADDAPTDGFSIDKLTLKKSKKK